MRTMNKQTGRVFHLALAAILLNILPAFAVPGAGAAGAGPIAKVSQIEGIADLHPDAESESRAVSPGTEVNPWDTLSTQDKTKLFLTWDNGLKASMGEFSSLLYSPDEDANGPTNEIQIIEGIVRVATDADRRSEAPRFFVSTPLAYVESADVNEPVDFIVEVHDPSKTVVTVVSGKVRIKGPEGQKWTEKTVFGCKTVFIEEAKNKIMVLSAGADDLERLISATTITGTMRANMEACRPSTARVRREPPVMYPYPGYPEYYEEVWEVVEFPYWEIRVIRFYGGYCEIWIPGVGHLLVPIPVGGGWVYDPYAVEIYARYAFCERALFHDRYYWRDLRMRRRELHNMIHLARQSGNTGLLMKLNRDLDYLNVRSDWAARRIHRLERRVGELQGQRQKFSGKMPKGFNLNQTIANSLSSQKNLKVMQKFQAQIRDRTALQNRLAGMAGGEIASLRNRIARERNPGKRMALKSELGKIKREIAQGKLPLAKDQKELRSLITRAGKSDDGERQAQARKQLLSRLEKQKGIPKTDPVNQKTLAEVKQAVEKNPNPRTRERMERRIGELERSMVVRKQSEAQLKKIQQMSADAAAETDPKKRQELLGTLRELSRPAGGAIAPATMNLIREQKNLEKQLGEVKDRQKQNAIRRNLDELRRKQEAQTRELQLEQEKRVRQQLMPESDRSKLGELRRRQEEEAKKQSERLKEQQERAKKQGELKRLQEEQGRKAVEQRLREQKERDRSGELRRRQEEEAKKQSERLKEQQEGAKKQGEMRRRQEEETKKQSERRLKEQQERLKEQQERAKKQGELKRRQEEQQRRAAEQARQNQIRQQQEQQKRAAEQVRQNQIRQQQERARRAAEQARQNQIRQQQEQQRRAAEQARQNQIRQQQGQQRRAAEQARQNQIRQQQEQQRRAAEQARQNQARQEQLRKQQEELKKKLRQVPGHK